MFIGHFAPALIASAHPKAPSLPILFVGAQLVDWAFFGFVMAGVENMRITPGVSAMSPLDLYDMPYTHSLMGTALWALGFAVILKLLGQGRAGALIGAAVVLSHWFMDLLVHVPDLTLAGSPPKWGLGLWNYPWVEMPLELGLVAGGLWLWAQTNAISRTSAAVLGGVLLLLQLIDWLGTKPEAPGVQMALLAWFGFAVATLAAAWASRSREARAVDY